MGGRTVDNAAVPPTTSKEPVTPPSREDPAVAGVSRLLGGPWGRHAVGRTARWWTPVRAVLVLTVLTSTLGFLAKSPCTTHAWTDEYQYTRVCYTDVYALYYSERLGSGPDGARLSVPYRDHPVEYPPVIGGLMWLAAEVTNAVHPDQPHLTASGTVDDRARTFFKVTAVLLAVAALLVAWGVARLAGRRRVWDAAMFALAPTLFFHAYTNWDLAAVALATLGMWAWTRRWRWRLGPVVAGVFLGLGTATKLYPVILLAVLLFLCWRARRLLDWLVCALVTAVSFAAAYAPAIVLSGQTAAALRLTAFRFPAADCPTAHYLPGWRWFWSLNTTRGADWDSLWFQLQHVRGRPLDATTCGQAPVWLNLGVAIATLLVISGVLVLVVAARRRPRFAQVAFLAVAGFLLVNKVDSPQYVLWLLPLAILARPRWPAFLAWQAAEVAVLFSRYYFFVGNDRPGQGVPIEVFLAAVAVRDLALIAVMALVVREVLHPEMDVVRRDGVDDPAGGSLDGAPDRWAGAPASRSPVPTG